MSNEKFVEPDFKALFESAPGLYMVLDPGLRVVAASDAYLQATMTRRVDIVGRHVFEVFPDNPDDPSSADAIRNTLASFNRVLQNRETDALVVQRYDVRKPESEGGGFEVRYWSPVNSPLLNPDGSLAYIMHRVENVTEYVLLKQQGVEQAKLTDALRERAVQMEADLYARSREVAESSLKLKQTNEELARHRERLEELVKERTASLEAANAQLLTEIAERKRAEETLREAQNEAKRYGAEMATLMDAVPAAIFIAHDVESRYMSGSRFTQKLFGLPATANFSKSAPTHDRPTSFKAMKDGAEIPPDELPVQMAAKGEEIRDYEFELLFRDGGSRHLLGNATPLRDAKGKVYGSVGAFVDITERKRAETELRENRAQLDLALRSANMGVWSLDLIENKRYFDDQVCRLMGIDITKFNGTEEEFYKAVHPDDREMLKAAWIRTIEQGVPYETEYRSVWPDGSVVYVSARGKMVCDDKGRPVWINGLIWDISARRRAEEELHKAKEEAERRAKELEAIMDAVPALIWITRDTECLSMTGNRAVYEFLGMPVGANVSKTAPEAGRPLHFKALKDGMEIPQDELPMQQAAKGKAIRDYELEYLFDDGTSKITLGNTTPLYDAIGQAYGAIAAFVDITERKLMEEELRKSRDALELRVQARTAELSATVARLEQVNAELQEFAHVASHDLQEPLRKIQTFCDMAQKRCDPVLDSISKDYLDRVVNSAVRMRQLLSDLLQFSRIATKLEPFRKIDLAKIVREAADVFEASVKEAGCKIEIENIPAIEADESQMLRLFQNLIGNALKFRGAETPRIKIYGKIDRKRICEIFVKDNGIGFDRKYAELIFKPFQRLHSRSEYDGTGMGLAICRKIVERHGGNIRAESEPGKGSTFIIRLPVKHDRWEGI